MHENQEDSAARPHGETSAPYMSKLGLEKADIGIDNGYFWDINV